MSAPRRALAILLATFLFTALLGGLPSDDFGGHAEAASVKTTAKQRLRAMKVALAQRGDPYRYGAAGPNAFDCSGLTKFSYGRAGRSIPRTTDQQKAGLRSVVEGRQAQGRHHPVPQERERLPRRHLHREQQDRALQPLRDAGPDREDLDQVVRRTPPLTLPAAVGSRMSVPAGTLERP